MKKRSLTYFLCLLFTIFLTAGPALTQISQDANSVIVEIKKSADEVSEKVHAQLSSKSNKLIANLEANLEAATNILNQKGEGNGKKFEDVISKTMADFYGDLSDLLSLRESTISGISKTQQSVKQGKTFINDKMKQVESDIKKLQADGTLVERSLKSLASRYKTEINSNEALPDDVNLAVYRLAQEIELNHQMAQVKAKTLEVLSSRARDFDRYLKYAEDIRRLSEDSFSLAEGQQKVLAAIAELRKEGIESDGFKGEMGKLTKGAGDFTANMAKSSSFLSKLSKMPLLESNGEPELKIPQINVDGKAILRKYLAEQQTRRTENK